MKINSKIVKDYFPAKSKWKMFSGVRVPIRLTPNKSDSRGVASATTATPIIPSTGTNIAKSTYRAKLEGDNIIIKGNRDGDTRIYSISLKTFEESLNNIKQNHAVYIKDLQGKHLNDFNDVKNIVTLSIGAGIGDMIYEPIDRVFGDIQHLVPGTVGAYLIGCRRHTDHKGNPACAATCAGNIQLSVPGATPCDTLALLYDHDKGFTRLNKPGSNTEAIIYYSNSHGARQHHRSEIEELMSYGVKRVKQITFDSTGAHYQEITPDFIDIGHIMKRDIEALPAVTVAPAGSVNGGGSGSSGGTAIAVVLIVIIILILIYLFMKNKGKSARFFD